MNEEKKKKTEKKRAIAWHLGKNQLKKQNKVFFAQRTNGSIVIGISAFIAKLESVIRIVGNSPEQRINHIRYFLLFAILRMNVSHCDEPFLPHRHLQNGATILAIVVAQQCHIG